MVDLSDLANRTEVQRVYENAKTYICCTLTGSSSSLFAAWTAAGSVGLAWAIVCSGVMMYAAATARKRLKPGLPAPHGGAMLWAAPPPATGGGGGGYMPSPTSKPSEIEPYPVYAQQPQLAVNGAFAAAGPSGSAAATAPLI